VTSALAQQVSLTGDQLQALAFRLNIRDLRPMLAVCSAHATLDCREAAWDLAARELASADLIVDGAVDAELAEVLETLARPSRELVVRLVTPDGIVRLSVARTARLCVLARRMDEGISLRIVGHNSELRQAIGALLPELPKGFPAEIRPVGAPLPEMVETLSGTHDPVELSDRIRALGAPPQAAKLLGTALGSRHAFAEIVYYALTDEEGRISRSPAAVGLFYTKRGRVVAAPSSAPTGQLWTTVKPGSDYAVGQAIGQLVALSTHSWEHR
jgi:hypothetical protein